MAMKLFWWQQNWSSDMNRILLVIILCVSSTHFIFGQSSNTYVLDWGGGKYFEVKSYSGELSQPDYIILQLGSDKMKEAEWRITATVKNIKIFNTDYKGVFPINMLNIRCTGKTGSSNIPVEYFRNMMVWNNLQGINSEVELITFESLEQNTYNLMKLNFELQVMGGSYLSYIPRWTSFEFGIEYKLYTRNKGTQHWRLEQTMYNELTRFALNIDPNSQTPVYSITVTPEVMLEYNSINGYMNGITKTYAKGLKVSATDAYEVKFKSLSNQFTSETTSSTLPLDLVSLQLSGGSGVQQPVNISTTNQIILQGVTTNGSIVEFDMIYKGKPLEDQLLNINEDQTFRTQLMFEITTR